MNSEQFMRVVAQTRPVVVAECRRALRVYPHSPVLELRDLVQEVHLTMWRARSRLARARNPQGWVRHMAYQTACRCLRRMRP